MNPGLRSYGGHAMQSSVSFPITLSTLLSSNISEVTFDNS